MAVGNYGITRPADVDIDDIDIYYNYMINRETPNNEIFKLETSEILSGLVLPENEWGDERDENLLEGLYNLRLPASTFSELGIYTIYIKPKRISLKISDCGVLSSLPNVKGIVINKNDLPEKLRENNALQGYRIEYIGTNGEKIRNTVRYVVSSNKVSPITENVGNTSQKTIRYRFDDGDVSTLFIQLTPSSSYNVKPNTFPFIGSVGQKIILTNTFFTPLVIEVEMVENTIDTLIDLVAGEQVKDVKKGILTYYDKNREITKQFDLFEIKDSVDDVPLHEVKQRRENIDESQIFDDVVSDIT